MPSGRARPTALWVCLFDETASRETERLELQREAAGIFRSTCARPRAGTRYGFRADGDYAPERGLWFDPAKLLVDPYAVALDRPFVYRSGARRGRAARASTPRRWCRRRSVAAAETVPARAARLPPGGLIYEVQVRAFTMLHPDVPEEQRGTVAALAHPAIIEHLSKLGVSAVELMPMTAWIDERHLPPLGLANAWGYNPVAFMALDPRLAPGGIAELRETVAALHEAGIGVILDLVFNHTGESDVAGPDAVAARPRQPGLLPPPRRRAGASGQRHRQRQHGRLRPAGRRAS